MNWHTKSALKNIGEAKAHALAAGNFELASALRDLLHKYSPPCPTCGQRPFEKISREAVELISREVLG